MELHFFKQLKLLNWQMAIQVSISYKMNYEFKMLPFVFQLKIKRSKYLKRYILYYSLNTKSQYGKNVERFHDY